MPALVAFVPHPDDETYSFGGLLSMAVDAGWRVTLHCATRGEGGGRHDGGPTGPGPVGEVRAAELRASCRLLGLPEPEIWDLPDGGLMDARDLDQMVRGALEEEPADIIVTLGRDGAYGHPDHLAVHRAVVAAWSAIEESRPALLFPAFAAGVFVPQYEVCVASGIMGVPPFVAAGDLGLADAHYRLPLGDGARDRKLAAIASHRSQLPGGDPYLLFPADIVAGLLGEERFTDATGVAGEAAQRLFEALGGG